MIAPYYLHWGRIDLDITVNGLDPASGNVTPSSGDGVNPSSVGRGSVKMVSGRGKSKTSIGRGGSNG